METNFINETKTVQKIILRNLIQDKKYRDSLINNFEEEFFDREYRDTLKLLKKIYENNSDFPTYENMVNLIKVKVKKDDAKKNIILKIIDESYNIVEKDSYELIFEITKHWLEEVNLQKMFFETKHFIENPSSMTIEEFNNSINKRLNFSIEEDLGCDFFEDLEQVAYDIVNEDIFRIPTSVKKIDDFNNGGLSNGSLTLFLGGSGVGKSGILCSLASNMIRSKKNVLYVTFEMEQKEIVKRITANLLDKEIDSLKNDSEQELAKRLINFRDMNDFKNKLIVKHWAMNTKSASDIRSYVNQMYTHKKIEFDVIIVDYLGLMASSNSDKKKSENHIYLSSIASELKQLAQEFKKPVITAHQLQRGNKNVDDVTEDSIAGSYGIITFLDMLFAIFRNDESDKNGVINLKNLKNRGGRSTNDIHQIGFDFAKMKLYDVTNSKNDNYVTNLEEYDSSKNTSTKKVIDFLKRK